MLLDEPPLFWSALIAIAVAPIVLFTEGSLWSLIPFVLLYIGLGALLWYAIQCDYPHWIEKIQELISGNRE